MTDYRLQRTPPAKHVSTRLGDDRGSLAKHTHLVGKFYTVPLKVALRCPRCNPNQYARHHSTHRKATP